MVRLSYLFCVTSLLLVTRSSVACPALAPEKMFPAPGSRLPAHLPAVAFARPTSLNGAMHASVHLPDGSTLLLALKQTRANLPGHNQGGAWDVYAMPSGLLPGS